MKPIETSFIRDKKIDHDAGSKPDRKAKHVDERIKRVLLYVSQCDREVVEEHGEMIWMNTQDLRRCYSEGLDYFTTTL